MRSVEYRLRRTTQARPAEAVFVPGSNALDVLRLCARLGLDPSGRIFAVFGGLLLRLDEPTAEPLPGVVRLRRVAANLYLPVDAELIPALLDDEAEGLTRSRGLVFLPGGVLGFDPGAPLASSSLLSANRTPTRDWRPLPQPPTLAARIEEIRVELPGDPDDVLDAIAGGVGTEEPRPPESGLPARLAAGAAFGAGSGIAWLGNALGLTGLAGLGARVAGRAVESVPGLSESILGRQGAALRELLREFREGDIDRALRRALPLGEPGGERGAVPYQGDQLPTHRLLYRLGELLGGPARGASPGGFWLGGQDVMAELAREYRNAAEQAIARGDFHRAAFIYGKLLRDYRSAAGVLIRGGLHHDAALLLLGRLNDRRGAAVAFEAAGEFDQAVALYRELADHEAAGDLLRRIGEEEAALEEYQTEAARRVASGAGRLCAGDLLLRKAGRPDLALEHFAAGWAERPMADSVACAKRLAQVHAEAQDLDPIRRLLDEADEFFGPASHLNDAGQFYNEVARLAAELEAEGGRDELRDRALLGLAARLREAARPGSRPATAVAALLSQHGQWEVGLVRDAEFAAVAASKPAGAPAQGGETRRLRRDRVGEGTVRAVAAAPESDEIFLGFEEGDLFVFRPERSEVVRIASYPIAVRSIGASADGQVVVVLRGELEPGPGAISTHRKEADGSYRTLLGTPLDDLGAAWVTPVLRGGGYHLVGLWDGRELQFLDAGTLTMRGRLAGADLGSSPSPALLLRLPPASSPRDAVLIRDAKGWALYETSGALIRRTVVGWDTRLAAANPLRTPPIHWTWTPSSRFEIAGRGGYGTLFWASFRGSDFLDGRQATSVAATTGAEHDGYLAVGIVRPGLVAGITATSVEWFSAGEERFSRRTSTEIAIPSVVACYPSRRTGELVVVCGDGFIARVPVPR